MAELEPYYIGWDVGGWNCDKNPNSRDAIVILDGQRRICGTPWRGNLRALINEAQTTRAWLEGLFSHCQISRPSTPSSTVMAIDTPLGFSLAFTDLITGLTPADGPLEASDSNPYLYRQTERFLFQHGLRPLSPVKDMIGSQAAKGMHTLAKFAPQVISCGVWGDGLAFRAFEAYPSACKRSTTISRLRVAFGPLGHNDKEDALTCALVAYLYDQQRETLSAPGDDVATAEGWIWTPRDALD